MIRTEGLTKVYESKSGRQEALQDVSIHVDKGDIFGIIGMSGAGKSTLLRLIGMLEQPTSGKVWIQGQDVSMLTQGQQKEQRKKLGIVFQGYNLLMQKTVRENVEFPLRLSKTPRTQRRERAQELLKVVGLGDREGTYPAQLSGGQKQRVAIAR
ncbi:MAG: ATP-binding cassette domain-containing protein, partial [Clostridia bacterium]